ncbi:MAG: hypothetical protein ACOYN5_13980 [Bacteroidales bacterium]
MKTDRLEQFISENRDAFDELEPSEGLWNKIEASQKPAKRRILPVFLRVAAAAAIFVAGYFVSGWVHHTPANDNSGMSESKNSPAMEAFFEAKAYYSGLINQKEKQVFQLTGSNPALRTELDEELKNMDKIYAELEQDLSDQVAGEEVIEAMIQHYRVKLEILEDVLQQLKSNGNNKESEAGYVI